LGESVNIEATLRNSCDRAASSATPAPTPTSTPRLRVRDDPLPLPVRDDLSRSDYQVAHGRRMVEAGWTARLVLLAVDGVI
jgi:hypothetical protein